MRLSGTVNKSSGVEGSINPKSNSLSGNLNKQTGATNGLSAYEIALKRGFIGTEEEWLASLTGEPGKDGYSPSVTVEHTDNGVAITVTDKDGTRTATVVNGKDGINGRDGTNGIDGTNGKDGTDGRDGISPTVSISKNEETTTISITDVNGTQEVKIDSPPVLDVCGHTGRVKLSLSDIDTGGYVTDQDLELALNSLDTTQARITTTATGTSIYLKNAAKRPFEGLKLYGRTVGGASQTTITSGSKNLVNMAAMSTENPGVTVTHGTNTMRVYTTENGTYRGAKTKPFTLLAGTTYTLSVVMTSIVSGTIRLGLRRKSDDIFIASITGITETGVVKSVTYTPEADVEVYLSALVTWSPASSGDATFSKIQLEVGSTATEYEQYGDGSQLTISSNPLCGLYAGATWYSDHVDCKTGESVKRIKTVVFDGSEDESWAYSSGVFVIQLPDALQQGGTSNAGAASAPYTYDSSALASMADESFKIHLNSGAVRLYVKHTACATLAAFIGYLQGRNLTLSYILNDEVSLPNLTASEMAAFESLSAYDATLLSNSRGAYMEAEYVLNTPVAEYVTGRFEELENKQGSTGSAEAERGVLKSWAVTSTIKATLYDDGLFTVRGSGTAPGYSLDNPPPWRETQYLSCIEKVVFDENIKFSTLGGWFDCVPYKDEYVNEDGSITSFTAYAPCTMVKHRIDIPSTCTATPISAFRALQPVHLNYVKCTSMSTICGETLQYGAHLIMSVPSAICNSTIIRQICDMVTATIERKSRAEMLVVLTDSRTLFDAFNNTIDNEGNAIDELVATHNFQCLLFEEGLGLDGLPIYWSKAQKQILSEILPLIGWQGAAYDWSTEDGTHEWSTTGLTAMSTYTAVGWPNQNCLVNLEGDSVSDIVPAYSVYGTKNGTEMPLVKHWPVSTYIAQPRSTALEELTAGLRCAGFVNWLSWRCFGDNNFLSAADQIFNNWGRFNGKPRLPLIEITKEEIRPFDIFVYVKYDENGKIYGGHTGFCMGKTTDGKIQGLHAQRGGIMFGYVNCPTGGAIKFYKRNKLRGLGFGTHRRF